MQRAASYYILDMFRITINNLGSIDDTEIEFPANSVTLVKGRSGAGKSTILRAIAFALTGKGGTGSFYTQRKTTSVTLVYPDNTTVIRTARPNNLTVHTSDGRTIVKDEAESYLAEKYDAATFDESCYISQKEDKSFLAMTQSRKSEFLDSVIFGDTSFVPSMRAMLAGYIASVTSVIDVRTMDLAVASKLVGDDSEDVEYTVDAIAHLESARDTLRKNLDVIHTKRAVFQRTSANHENALATRAKLAAALAETDGAAPVADAEAALADAEAALTRAIELDARADAFDEYLKNLAQANGPDPADGDRIAKDLAKAQDVLAAVVARNRLPAHDRADVERRIRDAEMYDSIRKEYDTWTNFNRLTASLDCLEKRLAEVHVDVDVCPWCSKMVERTPAGLAKSTATAASGHSIEDYARILNNRDNAKKALRDAPMADDPLVSRCEPTKLTMRDGTVYVRDPPAVTLEEIDECDRMRAEYDAIAGDATQREAAARVKELESAMSAHRARVNSADMYRFSADSLRKRWNFRDDDAQPARNNVSAARTALRAAAARLDTSRRRAAVQKELDAVKIPEIKGLSEEAFADKKATYDAGLVRVSEQLQEADAAKRRGDARKRVEEIQKEIDDHVEERAIATSALADLRDAELRLYDLAVRECNAKIGQYAKIMFPDETITTSIETTRENKVSKAVKNHLHAAVYHNGVEVEPSTLSGGEYDRLNLLYTLVFNENRHMLLLDETLGSLDNDTLMDIVEYLKESGRTVVLVAHQISTGIFDCVIDVHDIL